MPITVGVPVATGAAGATAATSPPPAFKTSSSTPTATSKGDEGLPQLDLVFTMDCTGSMGCYIQAAKQNIEAIVTRLVAHEHYDLRFGLVAYRDHPPQDMTYIVKTFPFTTSLQTMQSNLRTLSANGGGDGPEAVASALKASLDQEWRPDATKVCVLIADAPPHGLGESGDGFPNGSPDGVDPLQVLDAMSMQGICVYSVGCQPALSRYKYATDFFIAAAERTNGQAVALGSAASLADVIMGGAIEEMDLEKLSAEMESEVQQLRSAPGPRKSEEEVQETVWRSMQGKGIRTRSMKASRLQSTSSDRVTKACSLVEARESLASMPVSAEMMTDMPVYRGLSRIGRADTVSEEAVWIEEEGVTYEQASRLFRKIKCKKGGVF